MKLFLFGNTNNYPLILARALRRLDVDANLVVTHTETLHRPESTHPEFTHAYPAWIHDMSAFGEEAYAHGANGVTEINRLLERGDAMILNYLGPSLKPGLDLPALAFLTGSDLDYYANFQTVEARAQPWSESFRATAEALSYQRRWNALIRRQREGIRLSRAVSFFPRGLLPASDRLLDSIGVTDHQRFHIYMGDLDGVTFTPTPARSRRIRIFCGARLTWKRPIPQGSSELDYKGIDILLYGLQRFQKRSSVALELRLVEKGEHVSETKALVEALGLTATMVWLKEMPRYTFLEELVEADICIDNLGLSVVGMAGLDAMASGRPLIANARPEIYAGLLPQANPICHAASPEQVCEQLERLVGDRREREAVGGASREFVLNHWAPAAQAAECLRRLGLHGFETAAVKGAAGVLG